MYRLQNRVSLSSTEAEYVVIAEKKKRDDMDDRRFGIIRQEAVRKNSLYHYPKFLT